MLSGKKKTPAVIKIVKHKIFARSCDPTHAFVTSDGSRLYSLKDLLLYLRSNPASDSVFKHHTMHNRNDFATWTRDIFEYDDIAKLMEKTKSKEELIELLDDNLE